MEMPIDRSQYTALQRLTIMIGGQSLEFARQLGCTNEDVLEALKANVERMQNQRPESAATPH
ncbi:hypothetical protein [Alicyclobacillus sp. ALC3]|uniref:hypothetical protein n=1 Tax=Alicyclobacillus sp. ALC3 TaxID=2796143 RepID=UPI002379C9DB|nr:hypothetical protein [Alicyclobacillus sp. ALC3]WDL97810.1 hypothetical protein JC200_03505 [Alicyclobacillus sp. ALC3]